MEKAAQKSQEPDEAAERTNAKIDSYFTEMEISLKERLGRKVKVEYENRRGKKQHLTATGLLARCIQHECDHLEGQLFIDIAKSVHKGAES